MLCNGMNLLLGMICLILTRSMVGNYTMIYKSVALKSEKVVRLRSLGKSRDEKTLGNLVPPALLYTSSPTPDIVPTYSPRKAITHRREDQYLPFKTTFPLPPLWCRGPPARPLFEKRPPRAKRSPTSSLLVLLRVSPPTRTRSYC